MNGRRLARRSTLFACLVGIALLATGCPTMNPPAPTDLNESEQVAVRDGLTTLIITARTVGALQPLAPALGALEDGQDIPADTCPVVTATETGPGTYTVTLDYGSEGCPVPALGGATLRGTATATVIPAQHALTVTFVTLGIDGQAITGTATLVYELKATGELLLSGSVDLTLGTVDTISGLLSCTLGSDGSVAIGAAFIASTAIAADLESLSDPAGVVAVPLRFAADAASFFPSSGAIAFEQQTVRIELTFDADSPNGRTTEVMVGGRGPISYTYTP